MFHFEIWGTPEVCRGSSSPGFNLRRLNLLLKQEDPQRTTWKHLPVRFLEAFGAWGGHTRSFWASEEVWERHFWLLQKPGVPFRPSGHDQKALPVASGGQVRAWTHGFGFPWISAFAGVQGTEPPQMSRASLHIQVIQIGPLYLQIRDLNISLSAGPAPAGLAGLDSLEMTRAVFQLLRRLF